MQKYILAQRAENTVKTQKLKTYEQKILICLFMMDITKKDGVAYEPTTPASFQMSIQRHLEKMFFTSLGRSVLEETALDLEYHQRLRAALKILATVSSNTDLPARE